ncbi:2,5-diketo-D-gluconate reductase B [Cribrihabitans marinus]|uniref:2,5-diketo-D-gluconate reductase B n=1 Tax=Cribrihabitans marinus TaxID=1227549 RepID=A0A1H6W3B0_9RHOB|nr:aldo/keto reductase [Cribrihabitans marinus]GGH24740.1 oxidoreductase [Cribrihabitans marinus]SEJ11393.1 2,5-diketo-D-gluconate reductase B [Cribrihabitans marinus]
MKPYFEKTYQRSFGTFPLKGQDLFDAVQAAAETGYRAFDTAQMYENESDTGEALKATGLPRDEVLITTKVNISNFSDDAFLPSVEDSLRKLQVSQVDVLLLHWPTPGGDIKRSLQLLQQAHDRGLTKHIGVSNYTVRMMRDARAIVDAPLVTNQVEFHPLLNQDKLLAAATETGIPLSSYCSVARGAVFKHPIFAEIGETYDKSAAQVVLRWILQKGVSINTMSTKPQNIRANFDVMDFTLSSIDMDRIDEMTRTGYRIVGKDLVPFAPDFD